MRTERFRLALRELKPSDWERFERVASIFLAAEYSDLRTLASPSGDAGRDATLFVPAIEPSVAIQYSITPDWKKKVRATCRRLQETFPDQVKILVYASNQRIGADADILRKELLREHNIYFDPRDLSWFLERVNADKQRQDAAEELAQAIADPFLASEGILSRKATALTRAEARTGLLYLTLQWEDDTREKGLSKLSFEALVRAALRGTTSEHRLTRAQVREHVAAMVPAQDKSIIDQHVDSALGRMKKKVVRHWQKDDEFCLTFEEQQRLSLRLAELDLADEAFEAEISNTLIAEASQLDLPIESSVPILLPRLRALIELVLFKRGELFAQAVVTGDLRRFDCGSVRDLIVPEIAQNGDVGLGGHLVELFAASIEKTITAGGDAAQVYLRRFADSYTLFAFLRETPDVQNAVSKLFADGEIWLDTTVVLPVLAESLFEDTEDQHFSKLIKAAIEAGMAVFVTPGVLEEIERHVHLCYTCLGSAVAWQGRIPFLLSAYMASGRSLGDFRVWTEAFVGTARPVDDIADYLQDEFGVHVHSLDESIALADGDLRIAVQEIWHAAHERRRRPGVGDLDPITLNRLVAHDVENYVGVIGRRQKEHDSSLGYTSWWLTLDPTAFAVRSFLHDRLPGRAPDSPVISPDFFVNYLALGPRRNKLSKEAEKRLPVMLEFDAQDLPVELLDVAAKARTESANLPERVIKRRVRDALDKAKRQIGRVAREGIAGAERRISRQLSEMRDRTGMTKSSGL